jgi:phosphate transport system protein
MKPETRTKFHAELLDLETSVVEMGGLAADSVKSAVDALVRRDRDGAQTVIDGDDEIDNRYLSIERRILDLFALQTPLASDLRLVSVIQHTNLHLERVGDQAVNISKINLATMELPTSGVILSHLAEMADVVSRMVRTAMEAFERRDLDLCLKLPEMDDPVDQLNRGMYLEVVKLADDPALLEWGIQMNVAARALERVGDNAVDIGEQVSFLLTGEFREFTDASHD